MRRLTVRRPTPRALLAVAALTLAALAVRLVQLATPTLRWDEGWSLAHASLPWPDLWRVAAEEWHPPLYVALLKLWIPAGTSATMLRLPSVFAGVVAVPLTYRVARLWSRDEAIALAAAALMVVWPLHVYYSQVTRMYALVVVPILAAAWFALRWETNPSLANALALAGASLVGLWISYYAVWPLAAIWLYALACHPKRAPALTVSAALVVAGYLPWLITAWGTLRTRLGAQDAGPGPLVDALRYLRPTLDGMVYSYGAPVHPGVLLAPLLAAGVAVSPDGNRTSRREARALAMACLAVALCVGGVVLGAHLTRWFAPRYMVMPAPMLAMLLAWALVRIGRRVRPVAVVAAVALVAIYWPASTRAVYEKMLEVVDPVDPAADHAFLSARTTPGDRVYFNALAKAGWYAHHARAGDPPWSYAMRWDPIVEPLERIQARIEAESPAPSRLWFVLYKGSYGPNAPLKSWLDGAFYPAGEEWLTDTLMAAYVRPGEGWTERTVDRTFANDLTLGTVRWAPAGPDAVALEIAWSGATDGSAPIKVFVHLCDEAGRPVAQHDTLLAGPTQRHGLLLPVDRPAHLSLRIGLYDPNTGERVPLRDGGDAVDVGQLPL